MNVNKSVLSLLVSCFVCLIASQERANKRKLSLIFNTKQNSKITKLKTFFI